MRDKKVLLIGGAGFLGQSLITSLLKERISVFYADLNPIEGLEQNFILLNILEKNGFNNIDKDFTTVINLTGQITNPSNLCFQLNTKGIHNIVDFIKENNINLIQVSTLSVYGSSTIEVNEESKLNPETPYGICKAIAEYLIQSQLSDVQFTIIRLSNLYGEKQPKGMLAYLMKNLKKRDKIFFNNDGSLRRHHLNVDDAANILAQMSINFNSGLYNYPGNDVYSIKELITLLEGIINTTLVVSYEKRKPWENLAKVDSAKINITFNYKSQTTLKNWLTKQLIRNGY